jgi:oxygen-independent coproporphyrinogen III oxidase
VSASHSERLASLEKHGLIRTLTGYYYIAHYPPLRSMSEFGPQTAIDMLEACGNDGFELYAHFPFCEVRCSFCHFYKELIHKRTIDPEDAITLCVKELTRYSTLLGRFSVRSFYVGGGTPSLMSHAAIERLFRGVHANTALQAGAEVKFEIFPKAYEPAELQRLLRVLRAVGVTDLVVDLESGNQESLRYVGRGNSSLDSYLRTVDIAVKCGFSSIVTALVIGMPHETESSLLTTAATLASIAEVKVINTFPLIIRKPDPIHRQYLRNTQLFHSSVSRDRLWQEVRTFLRSCGFVEGPISYLSRGNKIPRQQHDKFECVNLLGLGPSAFGYLNGPKWAAQYFNHCNLGNYSAAVNRAEVAVWRIGILDQEDRARRKLIFGLANCKSESLIALEQRYGISVDAVLGQTLNALLALELIELDVAVGGIRYTELGLSRLEEISYFLGSSTLRERSIVRNASPSQERELQRHDYYIRIPKRHRRMFDTFSRQFTSAFMKRVTRAEVPRRPNGEGSGLINRESVAV